MKTNISLRKAWSLIIVSVVLIPVVALGIWYSYHEYNENLRDSLLIERISNQALSRQIYAEVERLNTLLHSESDAVSRLPHGFISSEIADDIYPLLNSIMQRESSVRQLMVLSSDAEVVAAINPAIATHWGNQKNIDFPEALIPLTGRDYIGSPEKHGDYLAFSMAVPIGKPVKGVLVAIIDVSKIWLEQGSLELGNITTTNYLLDRRGSLISSIKNSRLDASARLTSLPIVRAALTGDDWQVGNEYNGAMNESVYGTYTVIPRLNWILISEVKASEVAGLVRIELSRILFIVLAGMGLFLWASLLLAKRTIKPVDDICLAINKFAHGNLHVDIKASGIAEFDRITADFNKMIKTKLQANQKLQLSDRVFKETHEGIIVTDENAIIIDVNPAFCAMMGYSRDEVIGKGPSLYSSGKHPPKFYADMWRNINEHGYWRGEVWNRRKSGELIAELSVITALFDENHKIINYVGMTTDITNIKKQQEKLELIAHYDVLTQLPNRILFADRFTQAVAHSKRTETSVAVCFIDLDGFKPVNDLYGHSVGDQLLVEVAQRLKTSIREEDTVSRQGGDEFTLLLGNIHSLSECQLMLQRVHEALSAPYLIENERIQVSASSGVTLYPQDDADFDTLIRHADQAMYQAKQLGRNRHHFFNTEQDKAVVEKLHLLDEIRTALAEQQFCLYYQPKINMVTGDVIGAEALIRWQHPEKGLVAPLDFLPIIDGTELEIQVGEWVIEEALGQAKVWGDLGINFQISVNIASHHLLSPSFIDHLKASLVCHPMVQTKQFQLEILETSAFINIAAMSKILRSCRENLGVSIALDDFGTGYSSLTHLRNLPVNVIKIDQSFVRDMLDDPNDYAIIDGVLGLASSFNRNVIAEGVETTEHGLMLLLMGCKHAQGYGIARPMPADELIDWFENYQPNVEWTDYAAVSHNEAEHKIELFKLALKQWKKTFETAIRSADGTDINWPIMEHAHCHCGTWIKRSWNEQLFDAAWLLKFDESHEEMHYIANELVNKYRQGFKVHAREGLVEFQAAYKEIDYLIKHYQ